MSPVGVVSEPKTPQCFAFARHPRVSEQVWSGSIGYPGAGQYMEFHRKYGERGLRYHKVTDNKAPLSEKHPYYPDDIPGKVFEHAQHFCNVVKGVLRDYKNYTGRPGVVVTTGCAAMDAAVNASISTPVWAVVAASARTRSTPAARSGVTATTRSVSGSG